MLKVSETSSQGAMGFKLRGTDYLTLHFTEYLYDNALPKAIAAIF